MSKNSAVQKKPEDLSNYQFDTSGYVYLGWGIARDASTGKLVSKTETQSKPKKKQ